MKKSQFVFEDDDLEKKLAAMGVKPKAGSSRTPYDVAMDELYGDEEEKPKKKKPKAGSSRTTAPAKTTTAKPKAKAGTTRAPMVLDPSDRISGTTPKPNASRTTPSFELDPRDRISGDAPKPKTAGLQRNPMFLDPSDRISGDAPKSNAPRTPSFELDPRDRIGGDAPKGAGLQRSPMFLDPSDRISGTPPGSKPRSVLDPSKLTGKRSMKAVTAFADKLNKLPAIGAWLGPLLVAGEGAKFVADWYAYNTGAARVIQLGDYTAPCLDSNYDPYDDSFVDLYNDEKGTTYNLDYYGRDFTDVLNSFGVEAFTPRLSNYVYGVLPTLLSAAATAAVVFQTVGRLVAVVSGATGPGIILGTVFGVISIGIGWIVTRMINKLLASVDQWGPGAADAVAQFTMEQLTTSSNLQKLCGSLSEAAQDDDYRDRDEEPVRSAGVDTMAVMESAAAIKQVFKEIDQELQAEGDQEKLAEWRRTLKQAKQIAEEEIKG